MRQTTWTTYRTTPYTYDVANNPESTGGVHHHQVRKTRAGWQRRILQANGVHRAAGPVEPISYVRGVAYFESAQQTD